MKTKSNIFFVLPRVLLILLCINFVSSSDTSAISCAPQITLVNQDPSPAVPGDYVKVLFQVSGINQYCKGLKVELQPDYPLSLDTNDSTVQTLGGTTFAPGYSGAWNIPYKLKVSPDALNGDYNLDLKYYAGQSSNAISIQKSFTITVTDSQTAFDAVIQEASSSGVSIALANTGKYAANSVIVRIPEQESFAVTGTNGQMVGNLASGDYTIVSFTVSQRARAGNFSRNGVRPPTNSSESGNYPQNVSAISNNLKFDIYYTDNIGERRIVNMQLPLNLGNSSMMGGFASRSGTRTTSQSTGFNWTAFLIFLGLVVIGYIVYKKYPGKVDNLFKGDQKKHSDGVPGWVKNAKDKEKK